jgi:hypothetical protein
LRAPGDPGAGIELLKQFLQRVRQPAPPPAELQEWVVVDPTTSTQEHARWVSAEGLESALGIDCNTVVVRSSQLSWKSAPEQLRSFLSKPARFVAVVDDNQRFEYLVRRDVLVEQVARTIASEPDGRS